jgi:serine/threonine protein kinase
MVLVMKTTDLSLDQTDGYCNHTGDVISGENATYVLNIPLGQGASADVWLARRESGVGAEFVAAKVFHAESDQAKAVARARIEREAAANAKLAARGGSRHVVGILGAAGDPAGRYVLLYEYASAGTLSAVAKARKSPWSHETVAWIGQQITRGLSDLAVPHRDVKLDNILVDDADEAGFFLGDTSKAARAMIADLGLVSRLGLVDERGAPMPKLTAKGQVLGTLPYMPLESLLSADVDHRADQYALGVVLLGCLNRGLLPQQFDEMCTASDAERLACDGVDLSWLPASPLRVAIGRMLSTDRGDRFSSWAAVDAALAAISGARVP